MTPLFLRTTARAFSTAPRRALVLGSEGHLGSSVVRHLEDEGCRVLGADVMLGSRLQLPKSGDLVELTETLGQGLEDFLKGSTLDILVVASGGFAPGGDAHAMQQMLQVNLHPVLAAAAVGVPHLANQSLMVVVGATPALAPTPDLLAYGTSKAAVHHVVQSLGAQTWNSLGSKRKVKLDISVVGILPTTLDTPANREAMPEADRSTWTKVDDISKEILHWYAEPHFRPHSGSLVKVYPNKKGAGAYWELVR